ncbi:LolA family protein [Humidesulfovibrio idahonensis]
MRIRNIFKLLVVMFAVLAPAFAQANKISDAIQKRYDSLNSFQTDFQQELTNAASGSVEKRSGKIWFKQSLVRWETHKPEKELLVVGQHVVWNYFEADKVAMKYRTTQVFNSKTMIRFLSGKANLKEDFKIEEQGTDNGLIKLRLIPKEPEPTMVLAYMWVDPKTNMLGKVLIVDFFGNGNQVTLSNLVLDKKADARLFEFTPPSGVQVKDNTKQK